MLLNCVARQLSASGHAATSPRPAGRANLSVVETTVVDGRVWEELSRISPDPAFAERMVEAFRIDCTRLIREIEEGLDRHNFQSVKDSAHALKGGAGSLGAIQLLQFAERLEKTSHDALRARSVPLLEELERVMTGTFRALEAMLEDSRDSERPPG